MWRCEDTWGLVWVSPWLKQSCLPREKGDRGRQLIPVLTFTLAASMLQPLPAPCFRFIVES